MNFKDAAIVILVGCVLFLIYRDQYDQKSIPASEVQESSQKPGTKRQGTPYEENQVRNTITKNANAIQICYKTYLTQKPKLMEGSLTLDWEILKDGKITTPQMVTNDFQNKDIEKCVVDVLKKITFPEPPNNRKTYISHVFKFKNVEEKK